LNFRREKMGIVKKGTRWSTFLLILLIFTTSLNLLRAFAPDVAEWDVSLTAALGDYSDVSVFGVRSEATEGFDTAYDEVDPPAPPVGVVSYFWYPDNPTSPVDLRRLSVSMIPPSPPMTWTYEVKPVAIDGTMTISWSVSEIATIPAEYSVYLQCPDESMINVRMATEYSFLAEPDTTYTFSVIIARAGDVDWDGDVDLDDLYYVLIAYSMTIEDAMATYGVPPGTDIDGDGTVDLDDLYWVLINYG